MTRRTQGELPPPRPGARVLRATVAVAAATLAIVVVQAGDPGQAGWWAGALPFWLWMISPAVAAGLVTGKRPTTGRLIVTGMYLIGYILSSAIGYHDGLIRPTGSSSSLIVIFLPLYQWAALIVALIALRGFEALTGRTGSGQPPG